MNRKSYLRSFAGGEITPELFGRLDLTKNQTGLKTCLNFLVLPHGPIANRGGLEWVIETFDSSKKSVLLPFIYNTEQAYVLEFGDQYMRVHTQGGTVLEANKNITGITQPAGVVTSAAHGYSNGEVVYISGVGGMTQVNGRYVVVSDSAANTFRMKDFAGNYITTGSYGAYTAGGTVARVYQIATPYLEADLFDLHYTQSADVFTITHPSYQQRELRRLGATNWTLTTFTLVPTQPAPAGAVTVTPSAAGAVTYTYKVTAINSDGLEESLASIAGTNAACGALSAAGAFNTVTWTNAAGAIRYNVYRAINGLYGYVGQATTGVAGFKDENFQPDLTITPPEGTDPFTSAGNYPGAVGYFQGRRLFAGTNNKPLNLFGTRSGTESNLTYSIPTQGDDSIQVRLTARQNNTIRHIIPLGDLLLLTSGAEWKVDNGGAAGPITATNIDYRPQGYVGASNVPPVVTSKAVLYGEARGGRIREMQYSWQEQGYNTNDISIMAPHLFDGYTQRSMTYAHVPYKTLWTARSDGKLLGLTYVPEHEVAAWHQHETVGTVESVCAIPEDNEDILYAVVNRTINGRTVRNIERMHSRQFTTLADCFFVDSGYTYDGAETLTIENGLWHLEGKTVSILADGAVHRQLTVTGGSITLDQAASKVHVGLSYNSDAETLPLAVEMEAFAQGVKKNVSRLKLRVNMSSGMFAGPSFSKLREVKQRTTEVYGTPPNPVTGIVSVMFTPDWNDDAPICIRQPNPLPLTIVALVPDTTYGG